MTATAQDRVALVGATSHLGEQVRDQLVAEGYPGSAVELLDLDDRVGLVTEYGDEARVVLEAGADSLPTFRLACFCGNPATSLHFAPILAEAGGLALDCTGSWWDDGEVPLLGQQSDPESHPQGVLATPHPGAALLDALQPGLDLGSAVVTMLLPASEAADEGAEELGRQSSALLTFGETGEDMIGRQAAFDAVPDEGGALGQRITSQLARLGHAAPRLSIVRVPVFHGIAAAIFVPDAAPEDVSSRLRKSGVAIETDGGRVDSPVRVAGRTGPQVTGIRADGNGSWLWVVADNHHLVATLALRLIASRLRPPRSVPH